jgi:hypothetical protein
MKRWLPIIGGISLNLALGSLYAWSVFVLLTCLGSSDQ